MAEKSITQSASSATGESERGEISDAEETSDAASDTAENPNLASDTDAVSEDGGTPDADTITESGQKSEPIRPRPMLPYSAPAGFDVYYYTEEDTYATLIGPSKTILDRVHIMHRNRVLSVRQDSSVDFRTFMQPNIFDKADAGTQTETVEGTPENNPKPTQETSSGEVQDESFGEVPAVAPEETQGEEKGGFSRPPSPLPEIPDDIWMTDEDILEVATSCYDQTFVEDTPERPNSRPVPENRPKEIPQPEVWEPPVRYKTTNANTSNCTGARRKVPDAHPRANACWTRRPPPPQDNTRRARRPYDPIPPYYQARNVEKQPNSKNPRPLPGTNGRPEFRPACYMPSAAKRTGTNQPPATVEPKTAQEHIRLKEADWPEALRLKVADLRRRARLGEKFGRRGELHFEGDARYRIVVKAAGVVFVTKLPPNPSPSPVRLRSALDIPPEGKHPWDMQLQRFNTE